MKTIYITLILLFCVSSLFAHNEFFKRESPGSCYITDGTWNFNNGEFLTWMSYYNIPIAADWTIDFPTEIFEFIAAQEFEDAVENWNSYSGRQLFELQQSFDFNVRVQFSTNEVVFPNGIKRYAFTIHKFENLSGRDRILPRSFECDQSGIYTTILLNSRFNRGFTWITGNYLPPENFNQMNFQYTVCHELGHVIGLAHCSYLYPQSMMNATPPWDQTIYAYPKDYDIDALEILDSPVSIEDYIWINLTATYYNVNQTYFGTNTRTFVDEYPYGNYMVSWGPWKIEAFHGCGKVLVFETQSNSYINIPPLPDGYLWQRDANGRVLAYISTSGIDNTGYNHYAEVPTAIGNVPNTFITQGTLTSNTNWRGCVTITGTITVPSGITLTIHPNSIISFQNNASLIVNGTLNAQSCVLNGGLSNWGSVTFSGSVASSSVLSNVNIRNGVGIRCLNGANINIQNSTIYNCTEGIYIYNSEPQILSNQIIDPVQNGINVDASGFSPLILNNTITKSSSNPKYHQYQGIMLSNFTSGYIAHNDISGFMWGVYIGGGSDAYFSNYEHQVFNPNNRVKENSIGIAAGWGGYIFAGMWKSYGRNNSIYNNSLDAKSYQHSELYAEFNWWGNDGAQIYVDGTSTLDATYPLASDPWNQGPPPGKRV